MRTTNTLLSMSFFGRDAVVVAHDLLGRFSVHNETILRITEVEAYRWPDDSACHAYRGRTPRTCTLWGTPGHAYVYLCYGIHSLFNVVTHRLNEAGAVLIRACEPVAGLDVIAARRKGTIAPPLLSGPGKVSQALGIDTRWNGHCLYSGEGLSIQAGKRARRILAGPRVGVDYARPKDRKAPWRFADADSAWVSYRRELKEIR